MKTIARIPNPDATVIEMTIVATVEEWRKVFEILRREGLWPGFILGGQIRDSLTKLLAQVESRVESSNA